MLLTIDKIFCASLAKYVASEILAARAEISSEIFCQRNCHMATIPMNIAGITSKKTAGMVKNGILPEELKEVFHF